MVTLPADTSLLPSIQAERDAAFGVDGGDDERRALDELVLQLWATGVGTTRAVGRIDLLEDDAFAVRATEFLVDLQLVVGIDGGADPAECRAGSVE